MAPLPETVLQFGSGRFLRGFADFFIAQANAEGQAVGRVVIVQSTGDDRAAQLNRQGGKYHLLIRGLEGGAVLDRPVEVDSVSRALTADREWPEVLELARSPDLRLILSNTTEAGYNLDPADRAESTPPKSFPAKLLAVLRARHESGRPGVTVVPCELFEQNADKLLGIVTDLARSWDLPADFVKWTTTECHWLNTLVDRITTAAPADHPLLARDELLITGEPYALWAVQSKPGLPPFLKHPQVVFAPDVRPYFLRKVRILNGGHTALVMKAQPRGFQIVREAVNDPELGAWLERLLLEEVVPVLEGRVEGPATFARQTLERFRNPFQEHKLADIAQHHDEKVQIRLVPTWREYQEKFGRKPPLLDELLSSTLR
jgi:tagaturonate reductase